MFVIRERLYAHPVYVCIPRSFLVINVCNQGKTLCTPCINVDKIVTNTDNFMIFTILHFILVIDITV